MTTYALDLRTATEHYPGIGRYAASLAAHVGQAAQPGEEVVLLRPAGGGARWAASIPGAGELRSLQVAASPFSLRQQWMVPRLLRQARVELYHSAYYLMPYAPGVPTVLTMYDLIPLVLPEYASARARLLFRWTAALGMRASARVIAISEATQRDLLRLFRIPAHKVTVIPLAADPAFAPQTAQAVARVRERYGLPPRYVLYLGSNKPHKNLVRLVEAWAQLQPREETLVVAGAWDPRYPQARAHAAALELGDAVRFLGPVPERDLPVLYSGASLFVFPSAYEGFGLPVLEAMACGAPVACSRSSSLPEVAGEAAAYLDLGRQGSMAETMGAVLDDPERRAQMRERGLARAAMFSWARTAQETLALYREVLR
ncbi:MAG: glycosyltransferase family 4 protein [Anaerolineae bacterium]|nr:glycosyltransferase family 4 protein [Anaerolineae bacterium]